LNTLHFNGSVVSHPDNRGSFERRIQRNLDHGHCVYGRECLSCPLFIENEKAKQRATGVKKIVAHDCLLRRDPRCPHNIAAQDFGKKEKSYGITNQIKNQISDRGAYMFQNSKNKLLFATLTVPPFKIQINDHEKQKHLNQSFSKFIENLKKHYGLHRYIAVREGSLYGKRYHYHVVMDIPYVNFEHINNAWVHTLSDICNYSRNAFTTDKKARTIRSISSVTRYIAKYISKAGRERHQTRVYFCDRDTARAVVKQEFVYEIAEVKQVYPLEGYKFNDYVCRYSIKDRKQADKFFREVVAGLFGDLGTRTKRPEFVFFTDE